MTPLVSVAIATHNYGRFLGAALDSVQRQTFQDYEIVLIDDGSTDHTPEVVASYLSDPRLSYHRLAHGGVARAKNEAVRRGRAPLVAFLDADDVWAPEKLERQISLWRTDPDLGVIYCRRRLIDETGRELIFAQPDLYRGLVLAKVLLRNHICFSSALVSRAALDRVGLFDEKLPLAVDYDLWLRLARHYRFDYVDVPLVSYRTGHANLSRRRLERVETAGAIMKRFLDQGGREALDSGQVRHAWAVQYCELAGALDGTSLRRMMQSYLRALVYSPGHMPAWRGLLVSWWPESVRHVMRRLLGRPDWRQQRLMESTPRRSL